jgi:hypothetical protein
MQLQNTNNGTAAPPPVTESLQDMLARHEQGIMNKILQQTETETRQRTDLLIERQLQQAWERERDCWMQELVGTRTLGGAATGNNGPLQSTLSHSSSGTGGQYTLTLGRPSTSTRDAATAGSFRNTSSLAAARAESSGSLDPHTVQAHLQVVQQELQKNASAKQLQQAVGKLQTLTDPSSGSPVDSGYASAWQLISNLIQAHTHSPVDHAMSALVHFCQQFQTLVVNRVRRGALVGQDISVPTTFSSDVAVQCAAFCKLVLGVSDSPWPVLFYCLRCGDAVAAKEVLAQSVVGLTGDMESAVRRIVDTLAFSQRDASCFWEADPPRLDACDRRVVAELLERSKNLESADLHQLGVYALLCGTAKQPTSDTVPGFNTIEDYLFSSLWKTLMVPNPVDELIQLGEVIHGFGPGYFVDNESGGWSYALPLLATQQYQKALLHLAEVGGSTGLLHATHLGLILACGEVPLRNLGQSKGSDNTVASLLVAYSTKLLADPTAGSLAAFEYVARIPNTTQARREVAALIAKTGDVEKLVGQLNAQGVRQSGGVLEKRFGSAEISSLLGEAADILLREKSDRQRTGSALMCFMSAGQYADVLSLLNQLLSPPDKVDDNRQFWTEQTQSFHTHYLAKKTHVRDVLERDNQFDLVKTSGIMLELNTFFERLRVEHYQEALFIADRLQLLPTSQSAFASKETEYHGYNALVKHAYPAFVVGMMEILYSEHRRIKLDLQAGAASVVNERLRELEEKARLLVTFARHVPVAPDKVEILSRLESLMI